jgi:hypothetical protein
VIGDGGGPSGVAAGFADGGEDFVRDSALERLGLRLAAAEDQTLQTELVEDGHLLRAAKGVN